MLSMKGNKLTSGRILHSSLSKRRNPLVFLLLFGLFGPLEEIAYLAFWPLLAMSLCLSYLGSITHQTFGTTAGDGMTTGRMTEERR